MQLIANLGLFAIATHQRTRFKSGDLWREWAHRYPEIFDEDDQRLAQSQGPLGYHFFEWQAAVLLYQEMGYLSLVEKYQFKNHKRKQEVFHQIVPADVVNFIKRRKQHSNRNVLTFLSISPTTPIGSFAK